jgi:CRP/FNR family transcriptional regulator, cyclic AMP receptor protein
MDSRAGAPGATEEGVFLDWLSEEELQDLRSEAIGRSFKRGMTLFHEGEVPGKVVILTTGRVKVTANTEEGREVVMAFRGPGELLGEVAALDGLPRSGTVTTLEDVEALVLSLSRFHHYLERHPRLMLSLAQVVCGRLREADSQRIELAAYDTVGRVARRLLELSEKFGEPCEDGVEIMLPLSQEELASWAVSSREAVTKALSLMRELGWVETTRRHVKVCKPDELRRLAS